MRKRIRAHFFRSLNLGSEGVQHAISDAQLCYHIEIRNVEMPWPRVVTLIVAHLDTFMCTTNAQLVVLVSNSTVIYSIAIQS